MSAIAMTKLSSKGQVVLPENVRTMLGLTTGNQFMVFADGDTVILKVVTPPKPQDLKNAMAAARAAMKRAGIKQESVEEDIRAYRKAKRKKDAR